MSSTVKKNCKYYEIMWIKVKFELNEWLEIWIDNQRDYAYQRMCFTERKAFFEREGSVSRKRQQSTSLHVRAKSVHK